MDLKLFLKSNKIKKPNRFFAVTKTLTDVNGEPLEWEIRAVTTREVEEIREACTVLHPINAQRTKFDAKVDFKKYNAMLIAKSVVFPDLYDKDLQDSYGVKTPEDLVREMVDDPTEYASFLGEVLAFSETDKGLPEKVEEAKN